MAQQKSLSEIAPATQAQEYKFQPLPLPDQSIHHSPCETQEMLQNVLYCEQWCVELLPVHQQHAKQAARQAQERKHVQQRQQYNRAEKQIRAWLVRHQAQNMRRWKSIQTYHQQRMRFPESSALSSPFRKPQSQTNQIVHMKPFVDDQGEKQAHPPDLVDQRWFHWLTFFEYWLQDKWLSDAVCNHYIQQSIAALLQSVDPKKEHVLFQLRSVLKFLQGRCVSSLEHCHPQCMLLFCAWAQHFAVNGMTDYPKKLDWWQPDMREWWAIALVRTWTIMTENKQHVKGAFKRFVLRMLDDAHQSRASRSSAVWYWLLRCNAKEIQAWHKDNSNTYTHKMNFACVHAAVHLPVECVEQHYLDMNTRMGRVIANHQHIKDDVSTTPIWSARHVAEWPAIFDTDIGAPLTFEQYHFLLKQFVPFDATWCQYWMDGLLKDVPNCFNEMGGQYKLTHILRRLVATSSWFDFLIHVTQKHIDTASRAREVLQDIFKEQFAFNRSLQHMLLAQHAASMLAKHQLLFVPEMDWSSFEHGGGLRNLHHALMEAEWLVYLATTYTLADTLLQNETAKLVNFVWYIAINGYASLAIRLLHALKLDAYWKPPPERIQCLLQMEAVVLQKVHAHMPMEVAKLVMQW